MRRCLTLLLAAGLWGCVLQLDEGPGRRCEGPGTCSRGRLCIASRCVDVANADGGAPPDGGYPCDSPELASLPNLVPNPSFEASVDGWRPYLNATLQRVSGGGEGSFALAATAPVPPTDFGATSSNLIPDTDGSPVARYCLSAWVRSATATSQASLQTREYDRSDVKYGSTEHSSPSALRPEWTQLAMEFRPSGPAGTYLYFQVVDENPAQVSNEVFEIDQVEARRAW